MYGIGQDTRTKWESLLTNKEDDGIEPVVAEDEGDDEEGDAEEHGHAGDKVDEMVDFLSDGRLACVQT